MNTNNIDDKYELKCQSTDNESIINNKKGQVLVPVNKNIKSISMNPKNTFKISKGGLIYQLFFSIILIIFMYYLFKYVINKIGKNTLIMSGGKKFRLK